ncbi:hypothetical protein EDB89DRAFT_2078604 [Lactarius sanguifluus]|nr:hypothetical protein EDB89DRAFT_2078604 [Lactarius sanguifluus]
MSPQHHAQDSTTTNPPRHDAQDPTANLPPRHLNTVCNAPPSPTPTPLPIHRHATPTRHARPHHPLTHRHAAPTRRTGLCPPPTRYAAPTPTRMQDPFTADPPRHSNTARETPPSPTHPHATPTQTQDLVTADPPRHPNTACKTPPSPTRPHATPTRTQDPATADLPPRLATRLATPPNTALVISKLCSAEGAQALAIRHSPVAICSHLNAALGLSPHQVSLSATRWTVKNNLVVVAGPDTTAHHLAAASHFITTTLGAFLSHDLSSPIPIASRENMRWSRLLINGLPTGVSATRGAFTPTECHDSLMIDNPVYWSLQFTQLPSWVRRPDSYQPGSLSSLVVTFEDPDGSTLRTLLTSRSLYAFGSTGDLKRWKSKPRAKTPPS